jgi:hypothetical protein
MVLTADQESKTRTRLAVGIVLLSVAGVVVIAGVVMLTSPDETRQDSAQLVFSSVLPLFGTWVGTILAFYFARDNRNAATESTLRLSGLAETETPATRVMIPAGTWTAYEVPPDESPRDVKLSALHARMRTIDPPARRLPIRTARGAVLLVVHDSTLVAFAESKDKSSKELDPLTLGDMLDAPKFGEWIKAIGFVSEEATVADSRRTMASITHCNDVFVTKTGNRDEPAIGWLTNTLLAGVQ